MFGDGTIYTSIHKQPMNLNIVTERRLFLPPWPPYDRKTLTVTRASVWSRTVLFPLNPQNRPLWIHNTLYIIRAATRQIAQELLSVAHVGLCGNCSPGSPPPFQFCMSYRSSDLGRVQTSTQQVVKSRTIAIPARLSPSSIYKVSTIRRALLYGAPTGSTTGCRVLFPYY